MNTEGLEFVIGFDFNAHHEVWGSLGTKGRGRTLVDYLCAMDLMVVNVGTIPLL